MKYLKQLLLTATLALGLGASANAALITQDIIYTDEFTNIEQLLGTITVEVDTNDSGVIFNDTFVSLDLYGFPIVEGVNDIFLFGYEVDADDVYGGLLSLEIDTDLVPGNLFTDLYYFDGGVMFFDNYSTVFDDNFDLLIFGGVSLAQASVVSEPAMLSLILLGVAALSMRRKS